VLQVPEIWGSSQPPRPRILDCFFQLGNLAFAEADYKQALALSPQDEGANMRMGMLQGKMGFCEHRHRCAARGRQWAGRGGGGARGRQWPGRAGTGRGGA
jgi:hypothetical protein